jgi:hypothetical protein
MSIIRFPVRIRNCGLGKGAISVLLRLNILRGARQCVKEKTEHAVALSVPLNKPMVMA